MRRALIPLFIFILIPFISSGEELNAGFVKGLWYGSENLIANESTRIYVALRNNTDHDLTGTVRFTDNGTRIGVAYVSALPGRIVEAWVDWTPRYGEHTITASLSDVRIHTVGETPELAEVENTLASSTVFVDYDTDKDGVPNETDEDDDNDGVSDADEKERGTNPLTADQKKESTTIPTNEEGSGVRERTEDQAERTRNQSSTQTSPSGLERYVPESSARTIVQNVTERIGETKDSIDDYRKKRSDALEEYFDDPNMRNGVRTGTTSLATITRSSIDAHESFVDSAILGGKALLSGFYSLILWILSSALAYPSIIELFLLLFIVYIIYRTARRFGRRRYN